MEIRKGMQIVTPDDQVVGYVKNVVMTPQDKTVTHLVVERGFMFTEERVMPMTWVAEVNDGNHIVLKDDHYDFKQLPEFKEIQFIPVSDKEYAEELEAYYYLGSPGTPPLLYGQGAAPIMPPPPQTLPQTFENIPNSEVALRIGAKVMASDEDRVGSVESVYTDDSGAVTHIVISEGLLLKSRKVIPTAWIDRVTEDAIYLGVTADLLKRLPD